MDDLRTRVSSIESSLHDSRRQLQVHESKARAGIGGDVIGMRDALLQGDVRIQKAISEVNSFMKLIDFRQPGTVDLNPQINWLSGSIATILSDFETANTKANSAMIKTMTYQNSVNDVGHDVARKQRELEEAHSNGQVLAKVAESQLAQSEKLVREAEASVKQKTEEIENKRAQASALRSKLPGYESQMKEKNQELARKKQTAEDKKDKAILGGVCNLSTPLVKPVLTTNSRLLYWE